MTSDDEDANIFEDTFIGKFGKSREGVEKRLKAERRAGLTPKQRENRRAPPKAQVNFRATTETRALLDALVGHLGEAQTDVLEQAIAEMAAKHLPKGVKK